MQATFLIGLLLQFFFNVGQPAPVADKRGGTENVVVTIGQTPVSRAQFTWQMAALRASCYDYFIKKYGAYDGQDFWEHSFNGEVPGTWLKLETLRVIQTDRAKLDVMATYGILEGFDYDHFLVAYSRFCATRKAAIQKGGIVYGNMQPDSYVFYACLLDDAMNQLKQKMIQGAPLPQPRLRALYEKVKTTQYGIRPTVSITLTKRKDSSTEHITFVPSDQKQDELVWEEVYTSSMAFKHPGEEHWLVNAAGDSCLVRCISIKDNGYLVFSDIQDNVKLLYAENCAEKLCHERLMRNAVVINQHAWNDLNIR